MTIKPFLQKHRGITPKFIARQKRVGAAEIVYELYCEVKKALFQMFGVMTAVETSK